MRKFSFKKLRFHRRRLRRPRKGRESRGRKARKSHRVTKWNLRRFPQDSAFVKLKFEYSFQLTFTAAAAKVQGFFFKGNSMTPGFTATTSASLSQAAIRAQPVGYTTLATLYQEYKMFGSKVKLSIINSNTGGEGNTETTWHQLIPISSQQTTANVIEGDLWGSMPYVKKRLVSPVLWTTPRPLIFKNYMSTRKIDGISKAEFEGPDYEGTGSASPTNTWYWYYIVNNMANTNLAADVFTVHAEITYYVKFFGKNLNPAAL